MDLANGYHAVPVLLDEDCSTVQYLYVREHKVKGTEMDSDSSDEESEGGASKLRKGRTLFVCNLPPYVTVGAVQSLFGECGDIERILFGTMPTSAMKQRQRRLRSFMDDMSRERALAPNADLNVIRGRTFDEGHGAAPTAAKGGPSAATKALQRVRDVHGGERTACFTLLHGGFAHVVFADRDGLLEAMQFTPPDDDYLILCTSQHKSNMSVGLDKWVKEYHAQRGGAAALQKRVDLFMHEFDIVVKEERERKEQEIQQQAEDGWTIVHRKKKSTIASGGPAVGEKPKKKLKGDFYRFQMRQQRKEKLDELRKRFEEDKAKIARMKGNRKFRPY